MLINFRKDINGLRAIAVIAVVLFHFNPSWMPGGFAGVDVFFVISGFLMTGIIFRGLEKNDFSILNFYIARANRIIPALAVLCLTLLVFGWFYLTPLDYKALGKHVGSSIGFVSNVVYWKETGYFDASSLEKWLLHTWSLSVEWQFYILYPLALLAIRKFISVRFIKPIVLVGAILSCILCIIATYKTPSAAYYLLPTRAWEMLVGAVAYLYPFNTNERQKKVLELVGLIFIVGSYFTVTSKTAWPGYIALFPVLGAFFIIQSQRSQSLITGNFVFQKIGRWSYSIYLWHWPLVVAIYYFSLSDTYIYLGMLFSVTFGFLSYKYIEKIKFRRDVENLSYILKSKPLHIAFISMALGSLVFISDGFAYNRFDVKYQAVIKEIEAQKSRPDYDRGCFDYQAVEACTYYDGTSLTSNNPTHILLGDSHAQSLVNAIATTLSRNPEYKGLKFYGMAGCFFTENLDDIYPEMASCAALARRSINEIINKYPGVPVIYVNRLSQLILDNNGPIKNVKVIHSKLKSDFYATLDRLAKGRAVYFVTPTPEFEKPVPQLTTVNYFFHDGERVKMPAHEYDRRNKLALDLIENIPEKHKVKILDVKPYFCDDIYCYGDINSIPFYRDTNHVSEYGNKKLFKLFEQID